MDPIPRLQLAEIHQRELLAESQERRRAAQVRNPRQMRARAGMFLVALGEALLGARTAPLDGRSAAPLVASPVRLEDACQRASALRSGHDRPLCLGARAHACPHQ